MTGAPESPSLNPIQLSAIRAMMMVMSWLTSLTGVPSDWMRVMWESRTSFTAPATKVWIGGGISPRVASMVIGQSRACAVSVVSR